jgi:hypothetical protein
VTIFSILTRIDSLTNSVMIPFAALTLAGCIIQLITIALKGGCKPKKEQKNYLPWLTAVFIAAVILRVFLYPHHAGPMNDDFYQAQNARQMFDPSFHPINNFLKAIGWPFIVSIFFWATGPNQYTLFYVNSVFGILSAIVLFFLVYGITERSVAGIAAASFLAFHPLHSLWSTCGAGIVPAVFFMLLSLAGLFWFFRYSHDYFMYLSLFAASFAAQISAENLLLFLLIPLAIFFLKNEFFHFKSVIKGIIFPFLLAVPSALHEFLVMMSSGYEISVGKLVDNLTMDISWVKGTGGFSIIIIIFAALGLLLGWKKYGKTIVVFAALGAAYLVLLNYFWEPMEHMERYTLYMDICLIAIGSLGVSSAMDEFTILRIPALIACIIVPAIFSSGFHVRNANPRNEYFPYGRAMTEMIDRIQTKLPQKAVVIISDPAPFQAVTDVNVITPEMALAHGVKTLNSGNVFFLMDISARGVVPFFFQNFKFEMVYPMPEGNADYLGMLKNGLYRVSALDPVPSVNK